MGAIAIISNQFGASANVKQHLLDIQFTMTDNFRDNANMIAVQVYNPWLEQYSPIVSGPANTFQNVSGTTYLVRAFVPANGKTTKFRLLAIMDNGDQIPSATFNFTPPLVKSDNIQIGGTV